MFSALFRKLRSPRGLTAWPFGGVALRAPLDGQTLYNGPSMVSAAECATHGAVFACVRLLSETIGALELSVYQEAIDQRRAMWGHPMARLADRSPNPFQSGYKWMAQMVRNVCLRGNAFCLIERDPDGVPMALWPVPPSAVTVLADDRRIFYEVNLNGHRSQHDPAEVLHFALISDDGIRGLSILSAARRSIELGIEQEQAGLHFFRGNATPSGVIHMPTRLSPENAKRLRSDWERTYSGRDRRVAILEEGVTFEQLKVSFQDAEWLASRQLTGEDIARYFRVSPSMIGYGSKTSYSSSEAEWQSFLVTSLSPWLTMIEAELSQKLLEHGFEFYHETNQLARADMSARYAAYSNGLQAGWLTANEVRRFEGLAPIEGGEQLRTPTWLQTEETAKHAAS